MRIVPTLKEKGFTLIEVLLAMAILTFVLTGAYQLSSQAIKVSRTSQERSQAAQLIQEQAEALRALRDSATSWQEFRDLVAGAMRPAIPEGQKCQGIVTEDLEGSFFHVEKGATGDAWEPEPYSFCPVVNGADYYEVVVAGEFVGDDPTDPDRFRATIRVEWPSYGGSNNQLDRSEISLRLTDADYAVSAVYPDSTPATTPTPPSGGGGTPTPTPPGGGGPSGCTNGQSRTGAPPVVVSFTDPPAPWHNHEGSIWTFAFTSNTYSAAVPPGSYEVVLEAFEWRRPPYDDDQRNESYKIQLFTGSNQQWESGSTDDIIDADPDGNGFESNQTSVGCANLSRAITSVRTTHDRLCTLPDPINNCNPNSVRAVKAYFYPVN